MSSYYQKKNSGDILHVDAFRNILGKEVVETFSDEPDKKYISKEELDRDYELIPEPTTLEECIQYYKKIGYDGVSSWVLEKHIHNATVGNPAEKILLEYAKTHGTIKAEPKVCCSKCDSYLKLTQKQFEDLTNDIETKVGCYSCYKKRRFYSHWDISYPFWDFV